MKEAGTFFGKFFTIATKNMGEMLGETVKLGVELGKLFSIPKKENNLVNRS